MLTNLLFTLELEPGIEKKLIIGAIKVTRCADLINSCCECFYPRDQLKRSK